MNDKKNMPYGSGEAVFKAIRSAAQNRSAVDSSMDTGERMQAEIMNRFLTRVFGYDQHEEWVLKGGSVMLARYSQARPTVDVDLFTYADDIETGGIDRLVWLAKQDGGDSITFELERTQPIMLEKAYGQAQGKRLIFNALADGRKTFMFHVDVVGGGQLVGEPEVIDPISNLPLSRLPHTPFRVVAIEDHLADKILATTAGKRGRASTREKDGVDLVLFARHEQIDADKVLGALKQKTVSENLPFPSSFSFPASWGRRYSAAASRIDVCKEFADPKAGEAFLKRLIDPILDGSAAGKIWNPGYAVWENKPLDTSSGPGIDLGMNGPNPNQYFRM